MPSLSACSSFKQLKRVIGGLWSLHMLSDEGNNMVIFLKEQCCPDLVIQLPFFTPPPPHVDDWRLWRLRVTLVLLALELAP